MAVSTTKLPMPVEAAWGNMNHSCRTRKQTASNRHVACFCSCCCCCCCKLLQVVVVAAVLHQASTFSASQAWHCVTFRHALGLDDPVFFSSSPWCCHRTVHSGYRQAKILIGVSHVSHDIADISNNWYALPRFCQRWYVFESHVLLKYTQQTMYVNVVDCSSWHCLWRTLDIKICKRENESLDHCAWRCHHRK